MDGTYCVLLWDHETDDWSEDLAIAHLAGDASGLSWREIGKAIRKLKWLGWTDESMHVEREERPVFEYDQVDRFLIEQETIGA